MNTIDIVLAVILGFGLVQGLMKGLVWQLASFFSLALGIYAAIYYSSEVAIYLRGVLSYNEQTLQVIAFFITLFGVMILVGLLGKILTNVLKNAELGFVNRILGGIFGLLKYTLFIGVALMYLNRGAFQILPKEQTEQSVLYPIVRETASLLYQELSDRGLKI